MQKLAAPSQEVSCAHICIYLCEQERRTVTLQHDLGMERADEKGIGEVMRFFPYIFLLSLRRTDTFIKFEEKLTKRKKKKLVQQNR